jgi:Flp pilus assembly protein TadG
MIVVCLAIAGLAVDGTRVFLARRTLQNVADSAALAGASEVDEAELYSTNGRVVKLNAARAKREAGLFLQKRGIPLSSSVVAGSEVVRVRVRQTLATSFLALVGVERIAVEATAEAAPAAGSG